MSYFISLSLFLYSVKAGLFFSPSVSTEILKTKKHTVDVKLSCKDIIYSKLTRMHSEPVSQVIPIYESSTLTLGMSRLWGVSGEDSTGEDFWCVWCTCTYLPLPTIGEECKWGFFSFTTILPENVFTIIMFFTTFLSHSLGRPELCEETCLYVIKSRGTILHKIGLGILIIGVRWDDSVNKMRYKG